MASRLSSSMTCGVGIRPLRKVYLIYIVLPALRMLPKQFI
jgi:hypothetical protein